MPGVVNTHGQAVLETGRKMCVMGEFLQDGQASIANSEHLILYAQEYCQRSVCVWLCTAAQGSSAS